jgi:acyl-coenzyme A synthetase/AMP-(fatty) acid ligase
MPGDGDRLDGEELRTFTGTQMAGFKRPRVVRFVDELPRTATGKLQKFKLREPFWKDQDRQVN